MTYRMQLWAGLLLLGVLGVAGCVRSGPYPPPMRVPGPPPSNPPIIVNKPAPIPAPVPPPTGNPWKPPTASRNWQYIVLHHTAAKSGSVSTINESHLKRGWRGIGYHFVIGNGNGMPDGDIQPTFRWNEQIEGAHTGGTGVDKIYNQAGIGIVLIGNFEEAPPTQAQIRSARRLVRTLKSAYHVSDANIIGHRDAKATECPGKLFPMSTIKQ